MADVDDCVMLEIPTVHDTRGKISFLQGGVDFDFEIRRVYYTYDIPTLSTRAGHAHRALRQVYIALSGSMEVHLDDGRRQRTVTLARPDRGLAIGPGIWREISGFSSNAVLLVVASEHYDEDDYYRDYEEFRAAVAAGVFDGRPT